VLRLEVETLEVEYDLRNVFLYAGDDAELVAHSADLDTDYRRAGKSAEKHSPQAVAERDAVPSFQRLRHEHAFAQIRALFDGDPGFLDFHHNIHVSFPSAVANIKRRDGSRSLNSSGSSF